MYQDNTESEIFIIADFKNVKIDPEDLKSEIENTDSVFKVELIESNIPILRNILRRYHFPIVDDGGRRYIIFSKEKYDLYNCRYKKEIWFCW